MKNKKLKEDIFAYAVVLAVAMTAVFYVIPHYVTVPKAAKGFFTPRTFPYLCFIVIGACCVIGLIKSIVLHMKEKRTDPDFYKGVKTWQEKTSREKIGVFMPWICAALCFLYAILFDKIGFIWATVLIAPVILFILGDKKPLHYVYVYAFCAVMYVIFRFVLSVNLP